jgi:hypothetical protein
MLLSLWTNWWEDWELQQKVVFDGANKLIIVYDYVNELDVKRDIYSDWKEWTRLRDNAKFAPALRSIGGDSIGGGLFAGDIYFLINEWRILFLGSCNVSGVIFSDDFPSPFIVGEGVNIVTNRVSQLVQTAADDTETGAPLTAAEVRAEMDSNSIRLASINNKTDILVNGPTTAEIVNAINAEVQPRFDTIDQSITGIQAGLTVDQADMLLKLYEIMGLDPQKPLIVTKTSRVAGDISQTISSTEDITVVTRV